MINIDLNQIAKKCDSFPSHVLLVDLHNGLDHFMVQCLPVTHNRWLHQSNRGIVVIVWKNQAGCYHQLVFQGVKGIDVFVHLDKVCSIL